ncbi:MAG: ribbon-helix-helix domain-containing protein [Egibacteraceae bacterium]
MVRITCPTPSSSMSPQISRAGTLTEQTTMVINMMPVDEMMTTMRTTITIDDELYRTVKQRAAQSGRTAGEIIEDAVRRALDERAGTDNEPLAPLPTYGGTGVLPGVDLANNAALRDLMDADEPVDVLR